MEIAKSKGKVMYIVHFKDGTTRAVREGEPGAPYPRQLDTDTVSSIERVVDGRVYTIKSHPDIDSFFIKTTAELDANPITGSMSNKITERILGCFLADYKLEIIIDEENGHCKLQIKQRDDK